VNLQLLFLHALPLDGSMWAGQMGLLPGAAYAPTLYGLGDSVEAWASAVLGQATGERLIVVGCSVGGSCALEVAAIAPDRVAALVLIGTKARHRPDPDLRDRAIALIDQKGMDEAYRALWEPLLSPQAPASAKDAVRRIALRQSPLEVARGVAAFHGRQSRDRTLSAFQGPIAVVSGADDSAPGPQRSAEQAAAAPDATLHIVPDCGHYVPLERPDAINAILRRLIAEQG
jgi:pimeloyl-ACP methyl ester carboxylesterase